MALSISQLQGIFKTAYIRTFSEMITVPSFLRTFFPTRTYRTLTVQLEVRRGTEKIAVDVIRGERGNRNTFSNWTGKEYLPPYYKEFTDATQLDHYDRVLGQLADGTAINQAGMLARSIAEKNMELRNKIERAKELQCSQVLETGVVTMVNGDNIDFKRKAASMVDLGPNGGYWSDTAATVENQLKAGAEFIRQKGKNGTPEFNLVMSGDAYLYLKATNFFIKYADHRNVVLIDIKMPQTQAFGASYHGTITAGAYKFHIWTYDEGYENDQDVFTKYFPSTKAFIVPVKGTDFEMSHGAVPSVMQRGTEQFIAPVAGEYITYDNIDKNNMAHYFYVMSAPVALPITVDMIYTMQVLASGGGQG